MQTESAAPRGNLKKYQSKNPLQRYLIQNFLKTVETQIAGIPQGRLLEVGCGEGFVLKHLMGKGLLKDREIFGMDLDSEALRFASSFVPGVKFSTGSAYELPFPDKYFGCLMILEVLEHLETPQKALKEAARVSRTALVSVPHEPWFQTANFLRGKNLKLWGNDPEHINHWGISSFQKLLSPYGKIKSFATPFPWLVAFLEF